VTKLALRVTNVKAAGPRQDGNAGVSRLGGPSNAAGGEISLAEVC
jgi:hypothetical protein